MHWNIFYLVALLLVVVGSALVWDTEPYTDAGGSAYERKRARRQVGNMVLIMSTFALVIALLS